jgi:hypothetical protein
VTLERHLAKENAEAEAFGATIVSWLEESFEEHAAVRLDHTPGGEIARVRRDLYSGTSVSIVTAGGTRKRTGRMLVPTPVATKS